MHAVCEKEIIEIGRMTETLLQLITHFIAVGAFHESPAFFYCKLRFFQYNKRRIPEKERISHEKNLHKQRLAF